MHNEVFVIFMVELTN